MGSCDLGRHSGARPAGACSGHCNFGVPHHRAACAHERSDARVGDRHSRLHRSRSHVRSHQGCTCRRIADEGEMKTLRILTAVIALLLAAPLAFADAPSSPPGPPEIPPNGMGRYIIVLRTPSADAETPAHIEAPDVRKFGGSVVNATSGQIVATLPYAAINGLRANKNVAYVQRVWMGESPDRWRAGLLAITTPPAPRMASKSEANLTWDTGTFQYDSSGNIRAIGGDAYAYDSAGRIIEAIVNGSVERYGYDSFGNLTYKGIVGQAQTAPAVDSTSNRLSGKPYDAAGNMTAKDGYRYVYD